MVKDRNNTPPSSGKISFQKTSKVTVEETTEKISTIEKMSKNSSIDQASSMKDTLREKKEIPVVRKSVISGDNPAKIIEQIDIKASEAKHKGDIVGGLKKPPGNQLPDMNLYRGPRILVPIDLQAFVVPKPNWGIGFDPHLSGSKVKPKSSMLTKDSDDSDSLIRANLKSIQQENDQGRTGFGLPPAFDYEQSGKSATHLSPGIHLFWAMPDSLMRGNGTNQEEDPEYFDPDALIPGDPEGLTYGQAVDLSREYTEPETTTDLSNGFEFSQLPDRWIIVRQHKPVDSKSSDEARVSKCWVLESDKKESYELHSWSASERNIVNEDMTAIGPSPGDIFWTVTYDNAKDRFTFHDLPEDHLSGPFDYIVMGWYSDRTNDPLWVSENTAESVWEETVADLGWEIVGTYDDDFDFPLLTKMVHPDFRKMEKGGD